jgi:outer membrane protein insertion porin family
MDIHVECESLEHYQRWLEEEGMIPSATEMPVENVQPTPVAEEEVVIRGQSPEYAQDNSQWWVRPAVTPTPANAYQSVRGQTPDVVPNSAYATLPNSANSPYGGRALGATDPSVKPPSNVQAVQYTESIPPPAQGFGPTPGFSANSVPGYQVFPNGDIGFPGQPYPEQSVDIIFEGQETQTGRLQLGMGVNSDAGVVGNIVIDERNFDWRRYPRSWEDVRNGTAFRGAGQRFRIDASPGSQVNRYLVSFQEPYLFDSPISLGLSGSYFDRRFNDWDESRLGGRVSFGYQWLDKDLSTVASYRGESVEISNTSTAPGTFPDLDEVRGDNALHGFKLALINDTRDSAFLPTQGHYFEIGGEFVTGSFDYPRVDADYRKYFLLSERPDHSGRHVVSYATNVGWLGDDAPIYDRFFAGGFSTLRGFDFRGASPMTNVAGRFVETGGDFQWLNSLQYLFPITADDMLHGVVFCDFGTVEPEVTIDDFRVAPGFGLRVTVPAMGPAPIALDFAFPVAQADFDDEQVFSFSMGFSR